MSALSMGSEPFIAEDVHYQAPFIGLFKGYEKDDGLHFRGLGPPLGQVAGVYTSFSVHSVHLVHLFLSTDYAERTYLRGLKFPLQTGKAFLKAQMPGV